MCASPLLPPLPALRENWPENSTTVDFEDPLGYEWTVVIDGVIVPLASHAVAGRVAHINWYYYGPERQYCSRVAHITLLVVWTPFERILAPPLSRVKHG